MRLQREVAAQNLEFDAAQQDGAIKLDRLSAALATDANAFGEKLRASLPPTLQRFAVASQRGATHRGLYFWGGVGRGKTLLMDWFYDSLHFSRRERTHFYRFMRQVHAELRSVARRTDPLDAVAQRLALRSRVICLDEFFVADIADAMILSGLLEGLFRRGVILVATSNVPPQELYRGGLQRERFLPAIDLIQSHVDVLHLDGGIDYRLRQLAMAPTYLDSTRPDSVPELKRRFAALAGGTPSGPAVLSIEDRPICAAALGPGMAWFDFPDLCEGPRSQNDYIELAHLYHTIFLSNVPVFKSDNEDAARRFIMLIDELYDRGVKLVVSGAAAPDSLYRGERLQFEFQRAASRLIEMQTEKYLAGEHRP